MSAHHIILTTDAPLARLEGTRMPKVEFRQALFHCTEGDWRKRLYVASLLVTTQAWSGTARVLASEHQAFRFSMLYNDTWPEPVFLRIRNWPYRQLALRRDAPVARWTVEMKLRDLKLLPEERVEIVFLG